MKKVLSILLSVMLVLSTLTCLMLVPASAETVGTVSAADGGYLVTNEDGTTTAKAYYGNTFVAWYNEAGEVVSYNTTIGAVEENVVAKFNNYNLIPNGNFEDSDISAYWSSFNSDQVTMELAAVPGTNAGHGSNALYVDTSNHVSNAMNHVLSLPKIEVKKNTEYVLRYSVYGEYEGTARRYATFHAQNGYTYNWVPNGSVASYTHKWGNEGTNGSTPGDSGWLYSGMVEHNSTLELSTHFNVGVYSGVWADIVVLFNVGEDSSIFADGEDTAVVWFDLGLGNDSLEGDDQSPNFYIDNISITETADTAKVEMNVTASEGGTVSGPAVANKGAFMQYRIDNAPPGTKGDAGSKWYATDDQGAVLSPAHSQMVTNTGVYTATPAEGYSFIKWVDAAGNTVSTKATDFLANDGTVKAVFAKGVAAGEGGYLVDNNDGTVTAKPYFGNTFAGWYDADGKLLTGGEWDTLTITKDGALGVTAKFNVYNLIPDGNFEANDGAADAFYSVTNSGAAFGVQATPSSSNIGHGSNALYVTSDGPDCSSAMQYLLKVPMTLEKDTEYVFSFSYYVDGITNGGPNPDLNGTTSGIANVFFQSAVAHKNNWTASGQLGSWSFVWEREKADATPNTVTGWRYQGNLNSVMGKGTHATTSTGQNRWIDVTIKFNTGSDITMFDDGADTGEFWVTLGTNYDDCKDKPVEQHADTSSNFYVDNLSLTKGYETEKAQISVTATEGGSVSGPAVAQKPNVVISQYNSNGGASGSAPSTYISGNPYYSQRITNTGSYTAVADEGYKFMGWYVGDKLIATETTTDIYVEGPVVAKFATGPKATEGGYLVNNGDGTVTAKPYYGNTFAGWSNGVKDATIKNDDAYGLTANFNNHNMFVDGNFESGTDISIQSVANIKDPSVIASGKVFTTHKATLSVKDAPASDNAGHGDKALYVDTSIATANSMCYVLKLPVTLEKNKEYIFHYSVYQDGDTPNNIAAGKQVPTNFKTGIQVAGMSANDYSWYRIFDKITLRYDSEYADSTTAAPHNYAIRGGKNTSLNDDIVTGAVNAYNKWMDYVVLVDTGADTSVFKDGEDTAVVYLTIGCGNDDVNSNTYDPTKDGSPNFYVDNISITEVSNTENAEVTVEALNGGKVVAENKQITSTKWWNTGLYYITGTSKTTGNQGDTGKLETLDSKYVMVEDDGTARSEYLYSKIESQSGKNTAVADKGFRFVKWLKDGKTFSTNATIDISDSGNYEAVFEAIAQNDGFENAADPNEVVLGATGTTIEYATYTDEQKAMAGYTADMGDTYVKVTNAGDSYIDFSVPVSMKAGTRYLAHLKLMVISSDVDDPAVEWTEENPVGPAETSRMDFRFTKAANAWDSFDAWSGKFTIAGPNGTAGVTKAVEDEDKSWYDSWFTKHNQDRFGSNIVDLYYDITAIEDSVAYITFGQWAGGEFGVDSFTVTEVSEFAPTLVGATFNPTADPDADKAMYVTNIDLPTFLAVSKVETFMGVAKELGGATDFNASTANVTTASLTAYDEVGYLCKPGTTEAFTSGDFYTTFTGASTTAQKVAFAVRSEITLTDCYGNDLGITLSTDVYSRSINQIKRLLAKSLGATADVYNNADVAVAWDYVKANAAAAQ